MPDRHLSLPQKMWKKVNVNRVSRMQKHYLAIKGELRPKTPAEKKELEYFITKFDEYYEKTSRLVKWRFLLYVFLYATVIVNVLQTIPVLSVIVDFIKFGNALLGTTVLLVMVLWVQMKINLHLELMNESLTHMIVLYHKNSARKTDKVLRNIAKTL